MSHNVFKHQLTQIEFSFHADLENQGSKALYNPHVMSYRQPFSYYDLVKDRVFGGDMEGTKVVLLRPCFDFSFSDDGDYLIGLEYLYLIIWNGRAALILIDD